MYITSCLKFQINDEQPNIAYFINEDFSDIVNDEIGKTEENMRLLSHLNYFFPSNLGIVGNLPQFSTLHPHEGVSIGTIYNISNFEQHPSDSHSLTCFTEQGLKNFLADMLNSDEQPIAELLRESPLSQVQSFLDEVGTDGLVVIEDRITFRILRCSEEDIDSIYRLQPALYSNSRSEGEYGIDAFDIAKDMLVNTVSALDSKSYSVAKYFPEGDFIEFKAECGIAAPDGGGGSYCQPSEVEFLEDAFEDAEGTMYARYRINGEQWIDYESDPDDDDGYSKAKNFLDSIIWNDWHLFSDNGGGGQGAFQFHYRNSGVSGAPEDIENYSNIESIVDSSVKIDIDFQVVDGVERDIVHRLMGGDFSLRSCAIVKYWAE